MTPIEELADLRVRHENLKANEARIREHYLARLAACEQQLADSVADQARLSEALEQARRNYRVAAHELETAGRAQANVEQQLAAAREQVIAEVKTIIETARCRYMDEAASWIPMRRDLLAKLATLRPEGEQKAEYGRSKSMDRRLEAQGKPRPDEGERENGDHVVGPNIRRWFPTRPKGEPT